MQVLFMIKEGWGCQESGGTTMVSRLCACQSRPTFITPYHPYCCHSLPQDCLLRIIRPDLNDGAGSVIMLHCHSILNPFYTFIFSFLSYYFPTNSHPLLHFPFHTHELNLKTTIYCGLTEDIGNEFYLLYSMLWLSKKSLSSSSSWVPSISTISN